MRWGLTVEVWRIEGGADRGAAGIGPEPQCDSVRRRQALAWGGNLGLLLAPGVTLGKSLPLSGTRVCCLQRNVHFLSGENEREQESQVEDTGRAREGP